MDPSDMVEKLFEAASHGMEFDFLFYGTKYRVGVLNASLPCSVFIKLQT